ncbi:MAG TPA: hypothetical protein VNX68_02435, partial [Nitrosopumilaceae archaeon]|nr:hypothetical protein [Nitrosopumilaceae archaeon]
EPAFKNATYWSTQAHWDWATKPNAREKASFLVENILPIKESGQLKMIEGDGSKQLPFSVMYCKGHTESMMLPKISYKGHTIIYCADLFPSRWHIGMPYIMAYDVRPLLSMEDKDALFAEHANDKTILYFEHDPSAECGTLLKTERGSVALDKTFPLSDLVGK